MKLSKDQVKKLGLSSIGFVFLLYVYFTFFLGPLNRSRADMQAKINERQSKLDTSKEEMSQATKLEQSAKAATIRFAALKAVNSEGAPIAVGSPGTELEFAL